MAKQIRKNFNTVPRAKKPARTDTDGRIYASKLEMKRARYLRLLMRCDPPQVLTFAKQPEFQLGDQKYTADFIVLWADDTWQVEDVKGGPDTERFRMIKRLWPKYGPCRLAVMEQPHGRGPFRGREYIEGKAQT